MANFGFGATGNFNSFLNNWSLIIVCIANTQSSAGTLFGAPASTNTTGFGSSTNSNAAGTLFGANTSNSSAAGTLFGGSATTTPASTGKFHSISFCESH